MIADSIVFVSIIITTEKSLDSEKLPLSLKSESC